MVRLAILFLLPYILLVHGLVKHTVDLSEFYDNDLDPVLKFRDKVQIEKNPLWVLDLDAEDLDELKLRVGSDKEEREFDYAVGRNIRELERRKRFQNKRVKKDDPKPPIPEVTEDQLKAFKVENKRLKKEIIKFVNKLALSPIDLSDPATETGPAISIYFKGPYTVLSVKTGYKEWHYFMQPPSPLPAWFYTNHPIGDVEIPLSIRNPFYAALLHLLKMLLGFPV